MLSAPFVQVVPVIVLAVLGGLFLLGEAVITVLSRRRAGQSGSGRGDAAAKSAAVGTIAVALLGAVVVSATLPALTVAPGSPAVRWAVFAVGALVAAAGIGLRQWSIQHLGRFFTLDVRTVRGQAVVDDGPYRMVSHPSYTGALATYVGIGLMLDNWLSLLLVLLPLPFYVKRIQVEERRLTDELGDPYRDYLRRHRRLVPGLW